MEKDDILKFIEKNKDKIISYEISNGKVGKIKFKSREGLDFTNTNCNKMIDMSGKEVIVTNDGYTFDASYSLRNMRVFKHIKTNAQKLKSSDISKKILNISTGITNKIIKKEPYKPVKAPIKSTLTPKAESTSTEKAADFDEQKTKSDNLIKKLEEILQKYENNKKYENDEGIKLFRQKLNEIKSRYSFAMSRNDAPEMLNVKTKLVKLSGMIITKQNSLDKLKGKEEKKPPKRKPKQKNIKAKKVPKTTVSAVKNTPSLKATRTRFINQYNKKISEFDKSIALYTEKANIYKDEIYFIENSIANIDQIAKDNNFDSREKEIYLKEQKERLPYIQAKLKESEEQIKMEEEKKNAYNEEYVEVKHKNEFEEDGYIKKKEKREYAYRYYMQENSLENKKESKYSIAGDNPNVMDYHEEELKPKDKPRIR